MHKKILVANWKMNPATIAKAEQLVRDLMREKAAFAKTLVVLCPPFPFIAPLRPLARTFGAALGAQNSATAQSGTYTGEVSPAMLKSVGVSYVILGHSERRSMGETDAEIQKKVAIALSSGLKPVLAVGESERGDDAHRMLDVQLKHALKDVSASRVRHVLFAYEPRWAISKGAHDTKTAADTPENAAEKMLFIRNTLARLYSPALAKAARILYGGSVRAKNAAQFLAGEISFDGALIGGASLSSGEFAGIARVIARRAR